MVFLPAIPNVLKIIILTFYSDEKIKGLSPALQMNSINVFRLITYNALLWF